MATFVKLTAIALDESRFPTWVNMDQVKLMDQGKDFTKLRFADDEGTLFVEEKAADICKKASMAIEFQTMVG